MKVRFALALFLAAVAFTLSACTSGKSGSSAAPIDMTPPVGVSSTTMPLGLFQSDNRADYVFPKQYGYAIQYYGWQEGFQADQAKVAWDNGVQVFAELQTCGNPCNVSTSVPLADVVSGNYDSYLSSFGEAVRAFGHPVLITFDHEMNGRWYPWGYGNTSVAQWIAAWRHVTSLISGIAPNAEWAWVPNVQEGAVPFAQYWPGGEHISFVGLDGYLSRGGTWANTFAPSVKAINSLTGGQYPFIVAETGVSAGDRNSLAQIDDLVTGARSAKAKALMYFDYDGGGTWELTSPERSELISAMR